MTQIQQLGFFANNLTVNAASNSASFSGSINATAYTVGTTFIANTTQLTITTPFSANGGVGTSGQVLTSGGTGANAYWSTVSAGGGGGFSNGQSISVSNLAITGSLTANGSTGTSGQILASNGANAYWASVPNFNYNFAYSAQFNGSSTFLTTPTSAAFNLNGVDWTIECWFYATATPPATSTNLIQSQQGTNNWIPYVAVGLNTNLTFTVNINAVVYTSTQAFTLNSWNHVALVRSSGVVKLYLNGVATSISVTADIASTNLSWWFGKVDNAPGGGGYLYYYTGYLSNVRIVKGVAVYTGAFTVPTNPLTTSQAAGTNIAAVSSSQVSLLTCNALTLTDSSPNAFIITNTGGVISSTTTVPTFTAYNNATARTQTQTVLTSGSGTYYPPFGVAWLKVRMVGGGGGGGGSGSTSGGSPGTVASGGTNTVFGSSLLTAGGGGGGGNYTASTIGGYGGAGGTGTVGSGATGFAIVGGGGGTAGNSTSSNGLGGCLGGSSAFGGVGIPGAAALGTTAGGAAATNSGSGGSGGGTPGGGAFPGTGGGSGAYVEAYISSPAASYTYTVGAGGGGGTAGTSGYAGGGGGSGIIIIEENYPVTGQIPTNAAGTTQQFTANGTGSSFTLSSSINTSDAIVSHNGLTLPPTVDYTISGTTLNLNFIPANTDLIEVRTMSSSMSNVQSLGTRNKIINGAMAVDQRNSGASQTITAAAALAYTIDRWYAYCTGANVTGQRVAGSTATSQYNYQFTGAASVTGIGFGQRIEALNCYDLAGKTVTLSAVLSNSLLTTVTWTAYYATSADTFGTLASPTRTQIATGTFTVTSTLTKYSTNIVIPSAATTGIEVVFSVGAQTSGTWTIGTAQLESGSVVTPFEFRQYGTEFSLCQRYYQYQLTDARTYGNAGGYYVESYIVPAMRATPTVTTITNGGSSNISGTPTVAALDASVNLRLTYLASGTGDTYYGRSVGLSAEI